MIAPILLAFLLAASPPPTMLSVDLDGDGSPETVIAEARRGKIRIDVQNSAGKRVARAEAPAPEPGVPTIGLTSGSLGSAGALLEVSAATAGHECKTVWRLRGHELLRLPLIGRRGRLPDCSPAEGWTDSWQKSRADAPADYVRERTRPTPDGQHHRTEIYRFGGFDLRLDAARSPAEIAGVPIPDWSAGLLYPKPLIETLFSCFDLSPFKTTAGLRIVADRDQGEFALFIERPKGKRERLAVTGFAPGKDAGEWLLTLGSSPYSGRLQVVVASDQRTPLEVRTEGLGREFEQLYVPVSHLTARGIELFATAEDELALNALAGSWDDSRGQRIEVNPVSVAPAIVDFDKARVSLSIASAPRGADVLLLPRDGSTPRMALLLRGPGGFARLPVECTPGAEPGPETCRVGGPGDSFRRLGSAMNAH